MEEVPCRTSCAPLASRCSCLFHRSGSTRTSRFPRVTWDHFHRTGNLCRSCLVSIIGFLPPFQRRAHARSRRLALTRVFMPPCKDARSKSMKSYVMDLFERYGDGEANIEGVDMYNACYGGQASAEIGVSHAHTRASLSSSSSSSSS